MMIVAEMITAASRVIKNSLMKGEYAISDFVARARSKSIARSSAMPANHAMDLSKNRPFFRQHSLLSDCDCCR